MCAGEGKEYQGCLGQVVVHVQVPGNTEAAFELEKMLGRQVNESIEKPVDPQDAKTVHLSHFSPAEQDKGDKAKGDGQVGNDSIAYGVKAGFQRRVVYI